VSQTLAGKRVSALVTNAALAFIAEQETAAAKRVRSANQAAKDAAA
jgi:hypothetical protein